MRPGGGVVVEPTGGLRTTEGGGSASFTVRLESAPDSAVTISVASSAPAEGTVAPATLTFTPTSWQALQTVTVTGVDDAVVDGDVPYQVTLGATQSDDARYQDLDVPDVGVVNEDDDDDDATPGIAVEEAEELVTSESGQTARFTIRLRSQPSADVTVSVSSSDTTEGTVSVSEVIFTASSWSQPQAVTVTGVNDAVADGDVPYQVVLGTTQSADPRYEELDVPDVDVVNEDDDTPAVAVEGTEDLITTEAGQAAQFTIRLRSQPSADVTISVSSSDTTEGTVSVSEVVFTASSWSQPQAIIVTGVDDAVVDGDVLYQVVLGATQSADPLYQALQVPDVDVVNEDDDDNTPGIVVEDAEGLVTTEYGDVARFKIRLRSQPTADVRIPVSSSDTTEGTVTPSEVVFTPSSWAQPQEITVRGVDDDTKDGHQEYVVILGAAQSADADYAGQDPADVAVLNADNEAAGYVVAPMTGLVTTEAGGTATFAVRLAKPPTAPVTVAIRSTDEHEGVPSPATLSFTPATWNAAQTVTVTGLPDDIDDGDRPYTVEVGPATTDDAAYAILGIVAVQVVNMDDDAAGIVVTPEAPFVTSETGSTARFTVVLEAEPISDVRIPVESSNPNEGRSSVGSLRFTSQNWATPQLVEVTGQPDDVDDGDVTYTIVLGAAISGDASYAGRDAADLSLVNTDIDTAGIVVEPLALETRENGESAKFRVRLTSKPVADVVIRATPNDATEGRATPAEVVFTPWQDDWKSVKEVTITGVDDDAVDGDQAYVVVVEVDAERTADVKYAAIDPDDVAVVNVDDETPGYSIKPRLGLETNEQGTLKSQFTVRLNAAPTGPVVIELSSSDAGEGKVSPSSLTFTALDWETPKTATVSGVDDPDKDGPQVYYIRTAVRTLDPDYAALDPGDVEVTNLDDETPGLLVESKTAPETTEGGGVAELTVALASRPRAGSTVTVEVTSSDTTEGLANPTQLSFTEVNWSSPQTVSVQGVQDVLKDGDQPYRVELTSRSTGDPNYEGKTASVELVNRDDDTPRVEFIAASDNDGETDEAGSDLETFTVRLTTKPSDVVTVRFASNSPDEGSPIPESVTFQPSDFPDGGPLPTREVTVVGVDDPDADGAQPYMVVTTVESNDPDYATLDPDDLALVNLDDDSPAVAVDPKWLATTEGGVAQTFTVGLATRPASDVTISVTSGAPDEGTVSPTSVTFTPDDWSARTFTVQPQKDDVADGPQEYVITTTLSSIDPDYSAIDPADVDVTNNDIDSPGYVVSATDAVTSEAGDKGAFTVRLTSRPTADVTIPVSSSDTTEGTPSPGRLVFTAANWQTPQTVEATGANDGLDDGDVAYTIVLGKPTTNDAAYAALDPADVNMLNQDDGDTAGWFVDLGDGLVTSEAGGFDRFLIRPTSEPVGDVTVSFAVSKTGEAKIVPATHTFTKNNWNAVFYVEVTGVDDGIQDGDQPYGILVTYPSAPSDPQYKDLPPPTNLPAVNIDND